MISASGLRCRSGAANELPTVDVDGVQRRMLPLYEPADPDTVGVVALGDGTAGVGEVAGSPIEVFVCDSEQWGSDLWCWATMPGR